jgi:3-phenylpropionate/trans-cinnamate dioxygenase ferredoxin reductase subunit
MAGVVVIGGGQAGASVVIKLRKLGFDEKITLIGNEKILPYQRPPLSKGYLLGEISLERLFFRPLSYYEENNINLMLGRQVNEINRENQTIGIGNNEIEYDNLVLATGSKPILLPSAVGGNLEGVYSIRNLNDVDLMKPEFLSGKTVLVVGGGYIGLEAAAVAAKMGLKVILVEMADRILKRVAASETSNYFRDLHKVRKVDLREGVGLERLIGNKQVSGAVLTDGTEVNVDFVICGIGINPNTDLAEKSGLKVDNGIETNIFGETSESNIWAAGDCANLLFKGKRIRLESVQNAIDQAECVAENIMGGSKEYKPNPWFWSDQYSTKLQIAGLNIGYDNIITRTENAETVSFWYFKNEELLAVDAMNDPRSYMVGKRLIEMGISPDAQAVGDKNFNLKLLLKP